MDTRKEKAQEIAARAKITRGNGYFLVPSQSSAARHKVVLDGLFPSCTCPDFELREKDCKHMLAVRLWLEQEARGDQPTAAPVPASEEPAPKPKRQTYTQDWPNYNAAQTSEKRHFQDLLFDLCKGLDDPAPSKKGGRPRIPLADAVFAICFKIYVGFSARRFATDLEEAHERGHLSTVPHFNSVLNYLENESLTPILYNLIRESSLPLAAVETTFAVDSSGFCTSRFIRWFDVKYGVTREEAEWVKCHLAVGTETHVVTAVKIEDKHASDTKQFPTLVHATAEGFTIKEFTGDKAYASTENFQAVEDHGGTLYVPFKRNATGGVGGLFEKAFHYFCLHREEFLTHYHQRSNVESAFSMMKRKFGDSVRSKTDASMKNEVLCKIVCHNLCCLVSAMYELKIVPIFWKDEPQAEAPDLLKFPG